MSTEPMGGRVPVAVYTVTADDDAAELIARHVTDYCHARHWTLSEVIRDHDRCRPLAQRPGWLRILGMIHDRHIKGVVTYSAHMINPEVAGYETTRQILDAEGAFLTACRLRTADCRAPGDRVEIAGAASWQWPVAPATRRTDTDDPTKGAVS